MNILTSDLLQTIDNLKRQIEILEMNLEKARKQSGETMDSIHHWYDLMRKAKLNDCPNCGSSDVGIISHEFGIDFCVKCFTCNCQTQIQQTGLRIIGLRKAIDDWNLETDLMGLKKTHQTTASSLPEWQDSKKGFVISASVTAITDSYGSIWLYNKPRLYNASAEEKDPEFNGYQAESLEEALNILRNSGYIRDHKEKS